MATHIQIAGVVEEDDAGRAVRIGWLTQQSADENIRAAGFVDHGRTNLVKAVSKEDQSFRQGAASQVRAALDNDASRFAAGVGVDHSDGLHGCRLQKNLGRGRRFEEALGKFRRVQIQAAVTHGLV